MNFSLAFTFVFQDPDWLKKAGIAALVFLIPIIGPILVLGWGLEITRRIIEHDPVPLPGWEDFNPYIKKGFYALIVSLAYGLPAILLVILMQVASVVLGISAGNSNSDMFGILFSMVIFCMTCLVILFFAIAGFVTPAAIGFLAAKGELSAAFKFNEVFGLIRAAPGAYLMVILGIALANMLLAPLGMLVCGIGVLITTTYTTALGSHLTGQAYNLAHATAKM